MKIELSKTLVEFTPEADYEKTMLEGLWRMLVDKGEEEYPAVYADKECTCYCQTCNKFVNLKAGDRIPPCCGKLMELLD